MPVVLTLRQQSLSGHFLRIFFPVTVRKFCSFAGYRISRLPGELPDFPCHAEDLQHSVPKGLCFIRGDSSYMLNRLNQYVTFMFAKELGFLLFLSPVGR